MVRYSTEAPETSRDVAEGDVFLVRWAGEEMYALAFLKRGSVSFRVASNHVLPEDLTVIERLVPAHNGGANGSRLSPPAAIIEWQGERFHGLAFARRGRTFYRIFDGRNFGRADVIDELVRVGDAGTATEPPEVIAEPTTAAPATSAAVEPTAAKTETFVEAPRSGHWSDAIPVSDTMPTPVAPPRAHRVARTTDVVAEPPGEVVTGPTADVDRQYERTNGPQIRFDGTQWVGQAVDGTPTVVWPTAPRLPDIDRELTVARHRVEQLAELRRQIDVDREAAIAENIARLAAVDGVDNPATATSEQLATWRRYAEGIIGD